MDTLKNTKDPIFVDYYTHENSDCFKINLPFTAYNKDTLVLCPVSEGLKKAKELALEHLTKHIQEAIKNQRVAFQKD